MKKTIITVLIILMTFSNTAYAVNELETAISSDGQEIVYIPDLGGKVMIYLNGEKLDFETELDWFMTKDNFSYDFPETLVPIRAVCERIGYVVDWDNDEKIISITDIGTDKTIKIIPKSTHHIVNIDGHYYLDFTVLMQRLGLKSEGKWFNTLDIYKTMPLTENEKAIAPPELSEYSARIYKVGVDIPAGDYKLRADNASAACILSTYMLPSSPHTLDYLLENPIVPYEWRSGISGGTSFLNQLKGNVKIFENTYIVHLTEGDFCELIDCSAAPLDDETVVWDGEIPFSAGAYRVGTDLSAGEYVLIKNGETPVHNTGGLYPTNFGLKNEVSFPYEHTIISLKTDTFIYIKDCLMYPLDSAPTLSEDEKILKNGAFKVGLHLPVGAYYVANDGSGKKMEVSPIRDLYDITANNEGGYIFLEDGDILYLENAILDLSTWKNFKKTTVWHGDTCYYYYETIDTGTEPVYVDEGGYSFPMP